MMNEISPSEVKQKRDQDEPVIVIDVREDDEVAGGMIPGAKHIRLAEIPERLQEIDKDRETIMVCRSGGRSGRACEFLALQGYTNIKNMVGGMLAWEWDVE